MITFSCGGDGSGKTLGVNVRGSVSVQPTTFSGHYIYENDQFEQVRRDIKGVGNFSDGVQGRRILLATVRRTSSQGVIGLVITSDEEMIFDSGILQTDDLIFYEAP